jgi:DNA-binding LytR/AlgR family response regulator
VTLRHAAILALSAEDHYVRVRTDRGQALILINLAGAIEALGPMPACVSIARIG